MPDDLSDLSDLMRRLPPALPEPAWAPAAELRRIGRGRRRRRLAVVSLAVLLAVASGTGLGLRLGRPTAGPVLPGTSSVPASPVPTSPAPTSPVASPVESRAPIPASVMLVEADLPAGYRLTDYLTTQTNATKAGSWDTWSQLRPACAAYRALDVARLIGTNDWRYHSYYIDQDPSTPRIDEFVVRYPSPQALTATTAEMQQIIEPCAGSYPAPAAWFTFVVDGTQGERQYWTIASAAGSNLLAIVRSPEQVDSLGPRILSHLAS